jgi:IS5 family transposase
VPDETTILRFRRVLEKHKLAPKVLQTINDLLLSKGLMLRAGTVVDATLIAAPSSTKNADGERDPEMKQSKKGNQWYFGMKAHIGVDADSGLVHTVRGTTGSASERGPCSRRTREAKAPTAERAATAARSASSSTSASSRRGCCSSRPSRRTQSTRPPGSRQRIAARASG